MPIDSAWTRRSPGRRAGSATSRKRKDDRTPGTTVSAFMGDSSRAVSLLDIGAIAPHANAHGAIPSFFPQWQ
jgi:hypothetical protein